MRDSLSVILDYGHDDLALLVVVVQADQDIDHAEIRIHGYGNSVLGEFHVGSCRRDAEPDLDIHLLGESLDLLDIVIGSHSELVTVEEDGIGLEGSLVDEGLEAGKDLVHTYPFLGEVHHDAAASDGLVDIEGIVQAAEFGNLAESLLVPVHDVLDVGAERDVDHVKSAQDLVDGQMDHAGGLANSVP